MESRIIIKKQLEKSIVPGSTIVTNAVNEPEYVQLADLDKSLPTPTWRKNGVSSETIWDGSYTVDCDLIYSKVPLVAQQFITDENLYIQYGRLMGKKYARRNGIGVTRGGGIRWYSPCGNNNVGLFNGSGEIGGNHNGNLFARPNLIKVTSQNFISPDPLPIWAFYGTYNCNVINGDITNGGGGTTISGVPYVTGTKKNTGFGQFSNYHSTGSFSRKRPARPMLRNNTHARSVWFSRLVVIENGKVVKYGAVSEPVIFRPNQLPFSEELMSSMHTDRLGNYRDPQYSFRVLKGDIQSNYRD